MKAAILVESLTGNTKKAGELIAGHLQSAGWTITGLDPVRRPDHAAIQLADVVVVGTWTHGLFVVGQAPWGIGAINHLPALRGKKAAAFCTFALNAGKTPEKMMRSLGYLGADVLGGVALHRAKLAEHTETFAQRLLTTAHERV
jgi:menaquinone-dependent protoporphyrinogen IX oxidase